MMKAKVHALIVREGKALKEDLKFLIAVICFAVFLGIADDLPAARHDPTKINVSVAGQDPRPRLDEQRFKRNMAHIRRLKERHEK